MKIGIGVVQVAIALSIYLWARNHSPHMGLFQTLAKAGSFIIHEPTYSIVLVIAAVIGIFGVITIVRGLQAR